MFNMFRLFRFIAEVGAPGVRTSSRGQAPCVFKVRIGIAIVASKTTPALWEGRSERGRLRIRADPTKPSPAAKASATPKGRLSENDTIPWLESRRHASPNFRDVPFFFEEIDNREIGEIHASRGRTK